MTFLWFQGLKFYFTLICLGWSHWTGGGRETRKGSAFLHQEPLTLLLAVTQSSLGKPACGPQARSGLGIVSETQALSGTRLLQLRTPGESAPPRTRLVLSQAMLGGEAAWTPPCLTSLDDVLLPLLTLSGFQTQGFGSLGNQESGWNTLG